MHPFYSLFLVVPLVVACGSESESAENGSSTGGSSLGTGGSKGGAGGSSAGGSSAGGSQGGAGTGAGNGGASGAAAGTSAGGAGNAGAAGTAGASAGGAGNGGTAGDAGAAGTAGASGSAGNAAAGDGGAAGDAGSAGDGGAGGAVQPCSSSSECGDGVCVNGACCGSAGQVCGVQCCDVGQACVFDACVTPGKNCKTSNDCGENEYCETELGDGAGGAAGAGGEGGAAGDAGAAGAAGGAVCSQPLPASGKCLALPPVCDGNGQPAGCVGKCEFIPSVGKLNAVEKWSWGEKPKQFPGRPDVWSTPAVGRIADANCDGKVDEFDPPNVIFVSGNNEGTCCHCNNKTPTSCHTGVLRVVDGRTGEEIWSNAVPVAGSPGFSGVSVALGDIDKDGKLDVVAVDGTGLIVAFNGEGKLIGSSTNKLPGGTVDVFGWGGGLALGDMDGDGFPEIVYGRSVYTTKDLQATGKFSPVFVGTQGMGGTANYTALSFLVDLDGDGKLELVAGNTAYKADGTPLWHRNDLSDGFSAVGDLDGDGKPDVVLVRKGNVHLLQGATGVDLIPAAQLPGNGDGGPPTVADFDGDKKADIGVAQQNFYTALKPDLEAKKLNILWQSANHDLSSSVTGSSVFDFEGDGRAEVIYNDECFLWVYDGVDGSVRFAGFTSSFTGTESSVVADVDGDGHAEIVLIGNSADPGPNGWKCNVAPWNKDDPATGRPAWKPGPGVGGSYRGIRVFGDSASSWVGTRSLWSQHAYYVTNVCDGTDSACDGAENVYGAIPAQQKENWKQPWLNNFRQNVQEKGLFNAPDAILSLSVACDPFEASVSVKNAGQAALPAGVTVEVRLAGGAPLGTVTTTKALSPGQTEKLSLLLPASVTEADTFEASIVIDPQNPLFRECKEDNNSAGPVQPSCIKP